MLKPLLLSVVQMTQEQVSLFLYVGISTKEKERIYEFKRSKQKLQRPPVPKNL